MIGKVRILKGIVLLLMASLTFSTLNVNALSVETSTTYTVTNTNSTGAGSLWQAIADANANPGKDTINFAIPKIDIGYSPLDDVWIIGLTGVLPTLLEPSGVVIDGRTQYTSNPNLPAIIIQGTGTIPLGADLLTIISNHNEVYNLGFFDSQGDGIVIDGESNIIEGNQIFTSPGYGVNLVAGANYNTIVRNQICGHSLGGIKLQLAYTNMIEENLIGIRPSHLSMVPRNGGNGITVVEGTYNIIQHNTISDNQGSGISLSPSGGNRIESNTIGLSEDMTTTSGNELYGIFVQGIGNEIINNWVGGNKKDGIRLEGSNTYNNKLEKNLIGISLSGSAPNLQHGIGIYNEAHDNKIGNAADDRSANYIAGNGWSGIVVVDSTIGNNRFYFNLILYNQFFGVNIVNSPGNSLIGNRIIGNGELTTSAGVRIENTGSMLDLSDGNIISSNSIGGNSGKGIELINGANKNIIAPTIFSASCTNVLGTTTLACGTTCQVQIFSDEEDEGYRYEGTVTTIGAGNFSWSGFLMGPNVTAIVTDALGNSSEFSVAKIDACIRKYQYLPLIFK